MKKALYLAINLALILAVWLGPVSLKAQAASLAQSGRDPLEPPPTRVSFMPGADLLPASPASHPPSSQSPAAPAYENPVVGTCVVYSGYDIHAYEFDLYTLNLQIHQYQRLFSSPDDEVEPRFNHGCTRILYTLSPAKTGLDDLYLVNPDGSGKVRLTQNQGNNFYGAWSRDGSQIAFTSDRDGQDEIYVMHADGSNPLRLTYSSGDQYHSYDGMPAWSPDGTKIAFSSNRTGGYRIWVMNADGSNPVQLSSQPYSFRPQWAPDGLSILYDAGTAPLSNTTFQRLYRMAADGSNQQAIDMGVGPNDETDVYAGGWSPDEYYYYYSVVNWTYYQKNWYWISAYCVEKSLTNIYDANNLADGDLDWFPSWETYVTQAPDPSFNPLPAVTPNPFSLTWNASTITQYPVIMDVQYQEDNGPWQDFKTNASPGQAYFDGAGGHTYGFRARARDVFFNQSAWPDSPQLVTTVEALPPKTTLLATSPFTQGTSLTLIWGGIDPGDSGISGYDLQYKAASSSTWSDLLTNSSDISYIFTGEMGNTYDFRVRATDKAHNQENWSGVARNNTSTTFYASAVQGVLQDASGTPISGVTPAFAIPPFLNIPSAPDGSYAAYFMTSPSAQIAAWSKPGYGSLPPSYLNLTQDQQVDVYLPPAANAVSNGDFENASLSPADWTASGELLPALGISQAHSGHQSASLGASPSFTPAIVLGSIQANAVVDRFGVTHVVQSVGGAHVYSQLKPDGTWLLPTTIPGFGDNCWFNQLLVDSQHNVHLFFVNADQNQQLFYTRRAVDGTWSTPEALTVYTNAPSLAIDPDDHLHLSWLNGTDLDYMEWAAGTWSAVHNVTAGSSAGLYTMSVVHRMRSISCSSDLIIRFFMSKKRAAPPGALRLIYSASLSTS